MKIGSASLSDEDPRGLIRHHLEADVKHRPDTDHSLTVNVSTKTGSQLPFVPCKSL